MARHEFNANCPNFHFLANAALFEVLEQYEFHDSELREFNASQLTRVSDIDRANQVHWFPDVAWDLRPQEGAKGHIESITKVIPPMEAAKKEQLL